ncbi:MAG TPA: hypothetical protein VF008_29495 [Niastella sp.]
MSTLFAHLAKSRTLLGWEPRQLGLPDDLGLQSGEKRKPYSPAIASSIKIAGSSHSVFLFQECFIFTPHLKENYRPVINAS